MNLSKVTQEFVTTRNKVVTYYDDSPDMIFTPPNGACWASSQLGMTTLAASCWLAQLLKIPWPYQGSEEETLFSGP